MTVEWVQVDLDTVGKYGADAAVVLGLIGFRCRPTGEWEASVSDIAAESQVTDHRVRAALRVLRDAGAVHSHRADRFRPLLTWTVFAGQTVNGESHVTRIGNPASSETGESRVSSIENLEELPLVVPAPAKAPREAKRATRIPADYRPTQAHFDLASSLGVDLRREGPQFVDHHTAKGSTMKDWDAALRTWIRNAAKYAAERGGPVTPAPQAGTAYDAGYAATLPPPRTDPFARRAL